jgi:hypothetical protein
MMIEDDVPVGKKKKYEEKKYFLASLKSMTKEVGSEVRGTDPGIRNCTKLSRIPNTVSADKSCVQT